MGYLVELNGLMVKCDTSGDVIDLAREMARRQEPSETVRHRDKALVHRVIDSAGSPSTEPMMAPEHLMTFMETINAAGSGGVTPSELANALGFEAAKGIGGYSGLFNNWCESNGYVPDQLIIRKRTAQGRRWCGTLKLSEALSKIRGPSVNGHSGSTPLPEIVAPQQ